ncbi:MAG TPA: hypothetical protein VMB81_11615 [Candidatus Sulfotelmatobacter sp.]|nr:hypothetical protein [Candidatus Sulfotelmatobacter sp.]
MIEHLRLLAAVLLIVAELAGCAGVAIQPCDAPAYQSTGPCAIGRHKDSS